MVNKIKFTNINFEGYATEASLDPDMQQGIITGIHTGLGDTL